MQMPIFRSWYTNMSCSHMLNMLSDTTLTSVTCMMQPNTQLSDFENISGHFSELNYSKSTAVYVIQKWKVTGDCLNMSAVGRPTKLWNRDGFCLEKFGRTPPCQWYTYAKRFNRHPAVLFPRVLSIKKSSSAWIVLPPISLWSRSPMGLLG